jgi:hypothetical protein
MENLSSIEVVFVIGVILGVLVSWSDAKTLFGVTFIFGTIAGMTILNLPKYFRKEAA